MFSSLSLSDLSFFYSFFVSFFCFCDREAFLCSLAVFVGSLCIFGVLWGSTACSDFMFAIKFLLINDDSFWGSLGQMMILRLCRSAVRFRFLTACLDLTLLLLSSY